MMAEPVTRDQLEELAGPAPAKPQPSNGNARNGHFDFDLPAWIGRNLPDARHKHTADGDVWILDPCPWNSSHTGGCAHIIRFATGKIGAACKHNSCAGNDWQSLRNLFEPGRHERRNGHANHFPEHDPSEAPFESDGEHFEHEPEAHQRQADAPASESANEAGPNIAPVPIGALSDDHPHLAPPAIHGLARIGETVNLISTSKAGKSWLTDHLCLCFAAGAKFLQTFDCATGRILLIDNELHPAVISSRFHAVAEAMAIAAKDYRLMVDVLSLRGRLMNLHQILAWLEARVKRGDYVAVLLDAWYRALPSGLNENDNASVMQLYNAIDVVTAKLGCLWLNVHHASKGNQSEKSVVDVGAGAGAQSRAADAHLILRPHQEEGAVVFDAAVRSFPPIEPLVLRWDFPLWVRADDLDPTRLKRQPTGQERKQRENDMEGIGKIAVALRDGPATVSALRRQTGMRSEKCDRLLAILEKAGAVKWQEVTVKGGDGREYEAVKMEHFQEHDYDRFK
jgi:hypothetical protein